MAKKVLVLNGPNLARLDIRDSKIYGDVNYEELVKTVAAKGAALGFEIEVRQSNDEAELITWLHEASDAKWPVIFNPAAFTHYSYAIRDAADKAGAKARDYFMELRVAVTGKTVGPPLLESMEILGKEEVLTRIPSSEDRFRR